MPRPPVSSERLVPRLPLSVGWGPVFPRPRALYPSRQPCPVNTGEIIISQQTRAPERLKDAGHSWKRRCAAEDEQMPVAFRRSTGTPSAAQRRSRPSRRHARAVAAQGMRGPWRQQRLHLRPQLVRQPPTSIPNPRLHHHPYDILDHKALQVDPFDPPANRDRFLARQARGKSKSRASARRRNVSRWASIRIQPPSRHVSSRLS